MRTLLTLATPRRRPRGRHRPNAPRGWPVGWRQPVDPWGDAPMFDAALAKQAAAARVVFLAGRATVTW